MLHDDQLAEILIKKRLLSDKQLRNARERRHNVENETLEESLLFLGLTDYRKLGLAYAHHFKLPYQPVYQAKIIDEAEKRFPARMVEQLKFLPVARPDKGLVVVSCQPDDEAARERINRAAGRGKIRWAVASRVEIEDAYRLHYLGQSTGREKKEIELPFDFKIIDQEKSPGSDARAKSDDKLASQPENSEKKRVILVEPDHRIRNAIAALLAHEGYRVEAVVDSDEACGALRREDAVYILQRRTFRTSDPQLENFLKEHHGRTEIRYFGSLSGIMLGEELSPEELFRNYLSTVKLLLTTLTRDQPETIRKCHQMAHYARLMATSLGLKRKSQEGLILAIYLKEIGAFSEARNQREENNILPLVPVDPYENSAAMLGEIEDCFNLSEIIGSIGRPDDGEVPLEARIITLLLWFIGEFGRSDGRIRKIGAEQFYLGLEREGCNRLDQRLAEELFQIINHEQHLTGQGQSSGTILVIDPAFENEQSELHTRFIRAGYELEIVGNRERALTLLRQQTVLLIISEIARENYDGIAFCKAVKQASSSLPFIFFSAAAREETISQALLAGADDFIPKESGSQVAFLKMQRFIQQTQRTARTEAGGVSGALKEMGFMETIQILANREKDALILLENQEQGLKAEVYLHQGEIIHAHCGDLEGENAIYELLTWQEGFFQVSTPPELPERNVFGSTEAIMLEGCRLLDESQREFFSQG